MRNSHLTYLLLVFALSLVAACGDNPTGVGSDLLGAGSGDPATVVIPAENVEAAIFDDAVGNRARVLVGSGRVPDATGAATDAYRFSATAYLDFLDASQPDGFDSGDVTSVRLLLERGYVYGDTNDVTVELSTLTTEMETGGARNDTTLEAGVPVPFDEPVVLTPSDSLLTIDLPTAWISEYEADLVSEDFADRFHGFRIASAGAGVNTVVGFDAGGTALEVVADEDTVRYATATQSATAPTFTKFERAGDYAPSVARRWLVQDGVGTTFDFELAIIDSLTSQTEGTEFGINQATVRLVADTTGIATTSPVLGQPALDRFLLSAITDEGEQVTLAEATIDADGTVDFSTRQSSVLLGYLNDVLRGQIDAFPRYRLTVPGTVNTADYQLFYGMESDGDCPLGGAEACRPRLVVTTVPLDL